jgi:hypothetical protein
MARRLPLRALVSNVAETPIAYAAPCPPHTRAGAVRRVGLEVELGHLEVEETLAIVAKLLDGTIQSEDRTGGVVGGTSFGEFKVELDSEPLRERRYLQPLARLGIDEDSKAARLFEDSVLRVAQKIIPIEIITPPIPWDRLAELDPLWAALRARGAEDTHSSLLHAFGLHLNPQLPELEASTIVGYLRSFFVLQDWLEQRIDVDLSRRIAPYINPFPEEYRRQVVDPSYAPDLAQFALDYVGANATRNRPLDLLPLIANACPIDVSDRVDSWTKVKPRPAFHYRLPNCELSRPGWTPALDWNRWVMVERLATDRALLKELSVAYTRRSADDSAQSDWIALLQHHVPSLAADATGAT